MKKVFLEISQNSQENTCARVSCFLQWLLLSIVSIKVTGFLNLKRQDDSNLKTSTVLFVAYYLTKK